MKTLAIAITTSFLFATLGLSFTLAACGTADTPVCSSIFGMNSRACDKNPLEHHTAIAEQPTLCTLDALGSATALFLIIMVAMVVTTTLFTRIVALTSAMTTTLLHPFRIMNPFDPLRFAFIRGTIQQKRDVHVT
ncbi:MAG: hypothetical protein Q7S16_02020 [bacterium]|nr:hypothetical protein [bacterium]